MINFFCGPRSQKGWTALNYEIQGRIFKFFDARYQNEIENKNT